MYDLVNSFSSHTNKPRVVFEAFETSATCEKVLASVGPLQWDFPGCAVAIPLATFVDESFQDALTSFLEQASTEFVTRFAAVTHKAEATIPEIRDTSDPSLVSGLLMAMLEANGESYPAKLLRKRVRDTVAFDHARKPWRRSAYYLVLRVAIQRYLYRAFGEDVGRLYYKTIMCLLMAQLLEDVLKRIPLEGAYFLRQKLGRRLAKLASDVDNAPDIAKLAHGQLMRFLESNLQGTLATTVAYLKSVWRNHRQQGERFVPTLRRLAYNSEFGLRLLNSGKVIQAVLAHPANHSVTQQRSATELLTQFECSVAFVKPYVAELSSHIHMSKYHKDNIAPIKTSNQSDEMYILSSGKVVQEYVSKILDANKDYSNPLSQMFLHLMELWVRMDKAAVASYPLLKNYHPGFDADILDPIQLLTLTDMERAQDVRVYIANRYRSRSDMRTKTIFDDPEDDSFAVQYYDNLDLDGKLEQIRYEIEDKAEQYRDAKETEWEEKRILHEDIVRKRNEKECVYDTFRAWDGTTEHRHRTPCTWHTLNYEAKNIRITIFEHPLPSYEPTAKATLFELQCPKELAAYRDATWLILSQLCYPPLDELDKISPIRNYSQLTPYINETRTRVTLGSYKKAHLESHYATWGFPVAIDDILRTCGLKPKYYDSASNVWTSISSKAALWHHFPMMLPTDSPFRYLGIDYTHWPTSNDIQAGQARCPQGLSVHEFTAWQGLLVGTNSRWLDLLREMGSTNINFSSESTWLIVLRLVLQQGPGTARDSPQRMCIVHC